MIKREESLLIFLLFCVVALLLYEHRQIVNSRGAVFKQQCENFSIQIFSENGRRIMVQEFNPGYDLFGQDEKIITETADETINQLGKMITTRFGNGVICHHAEKKVILKNFTRQEVIRQMVKFVAENQEDDGYEFSAGYEPAVVCENVTNNYNTGL